MTHRLFIRAAALAAALGAGCALAQTRPPVTDVGPAPAEDRSSAGAIVLDNAPVRAQRAAAADPAAATRTMGNVGNMGQGPDRAAIKQRMRDDRTRQRGEDVRELQERGAGSLISQ